MSAPSDPHRDMFDAGGRGLQHHGLRRANERAVLTVIGFNPGVFNAEISRLSGLAPQTVSAILNDIESQGLITRGEVLRGRRGQPATPIFLRPDGAFSVGVEIGWRHLDVLLLDLVAGVRVHRHLVYDFPDAASIVSTIATMIEEVVAGLTDDQQSRICGVGVALPSNLAVNLPLAGAPAGQEGLWQQLDLAGDLARVTGLDVSLFNDGNAACWAELIASERPRPSSFVYFLISRFIAAGIVTEGTLWEGVTGNSANLGSMLVGDGADALQPAHSTASVAALSRRLMDAGFAVDEARPDTWDRPELEPVLEPWIADSARVLARVIFNTAAVIESSMVVLDAIVPPPLVRRLVDRLEVELRALPVPGFVPPQVLCGHLGALAPAVGAAELTLYRRYFSRTFADIAG